MRSFSIIKSALDKFLSPSEDKQANNSEHTSHLDNEDSKIHPAIEYFHQLHRSAPSTHLKVVLSSFDEPRSIDANTFAEGVRKFVQLSNSNPLVKRVPQSEYDRKTLYGNIYSGLHYQNDLAKLWNTNEHGQSIEAAQISTLSPLDWDSVGQDGFFVLIYRGQQPAQALDELIKGPTVIDCGMFAQLSLWFGIRYMLGNERFNQYFGRSPFFITQTVYNDVYDSDKPYLGNPLYTFLSTKDHGIAPTVTVKHFTNSPLYNLKHPGGSYGGENCILIDNQYHIFDPLLEKTQGLTESEVLTLLHQAFNQERLPSDADKLAVYAKNPDVFHSVFFQTFGELAKTADNLQDTQLTEEEFQQVKQNPSLELTFDLDKFANWLHVMEENRVKEPVEYVPKSIDHSQLPIELLNVIPFENKLSMDFSKFKQQTPQQKELMAISKQFCHSVMSNESTLVILTGKAGVGKTASAVCAAKELAANGKKVAWISEVMVHGWADRAKSMQDLANCDLEIDKLLATNPDAIFLDDDNLTGFSGNILLEKIYAWYVKNPGKALLITSNEPINFKKCYGFHLDGYHYPPFNAYHSPQYMNWQYKTDLSGDSLRSKQEGQSIGAIVSDENWQRNQSKLIDIEIVPGFDEGLDLVPIRQSLAKTGSVGKGYDKLSALQKRWIQVHEVSGMFFYSHGKSYYEEPFMTANPLKFEETTCKTIALEIREIDAPYCGKEIDLDSMNQLIRILNYAHDQGGRRVILINQTSFSHEELLMQIQKQLPQAERERTWSRFQTLFCETADTIFNYDQFNGRIKNKASPGKRFFNENNNHLYDSISNRKKPKQYFLKGMSGGIKSDYIFPNIGFENSENENGLSSFMKKMQLRFFNNVKLDKSDHSQEKELLSPHSHDATQQHNYDKAFGILLRK